MAPPCTVVKELSSSDVGSRTRWLLSDTTRASKGNSSWAVFLTETVDAHLDRRVVRPVPQLDVGIDRPALGAQLNHHALDIGGRKGPGAERAALNVNE
eukprot:scaffold208325_cov37-Tisochrysis_lutea.AAC.1